MGGGGSVCKQSICNHVARFVILFYFDMQHDHVQGVRVGVLWQNMCYDVRDMQHDHVLKKYIFDPAGGGGVLQAKCLQQCCCIRDSI